LSKFIFSSIVVKGHLVNMKHIINLFLILLISSLLLACSTNFQRSDAHKGDIYYWPKTFKKSTGTILTIYQPQIIEWTEYKFIKVRMVLTYQENIDEKRLYGTVVLTANTVVDLPTKNVNLTNLKITSLSAADRTFAADKELKEEIQNMLPETGIIMSLDRVTANYRRKAGINNSSNIKAPPPRIFVSKSPAVLIILNGKPIWSPIKGIKLKFAVNTNWDLFRDESTKLFYVLYAKNWFTTNDLQKPWNPVLKLPDDFFNFPDTQNWKNVKENLTNNSNSSIATPRFFISYKPAEMILINGNQNLSPFQIHN